MNRSLIAVDVGNSRLKLGLFEVGESRALPAPGRVLELDSHADDFEAQLDDWASPQTSGARWAVASVNRDVRRRLVDWLARERPHDEVAPVDYRALPLTIELPEPEQVGIDRLLAAVAANRLRAAGQTAVVVDMGSAITVDKISAEGAFCGGAILPGIRMAARALHEQTDVLPDAAMRELSTPPPALGASTLTAIEAGLYWGAVGAVRELIGQFAAGAKGPPLVLLTGGAAPAVAKLLGDDARYVPHLVLAGIAIAQQAGE